MLSIPDHRKNINSNECCFAFETEICGSDGDFLNYVSGMQLKTTVEFINFPCNNFVFHICYFVFVYLCICIFGEFGI